MRVDGHDLVLQASSPPPPAVLDLLRLNKANVVALLRSADGEWSVEDWQALFDARAAQFDGRQVPARAEEAAFEWCLAEWMNRHPERSDPRQCAGCGRPERDGRAVVPFGTGPPVWLHPECWHEWYRSRREQARRVLADVSLPSEAPA